MYLHHYKRRSCAPKIAKVWTDVYKSMVQVVPNVDNYRRAEQMAMPDMPR